MHVCTFDDGEERSRGVAVKNDRELLFKRKLFFQFSRTKIYLLSFLDLSEEGYIVF